jgi:hypothetical protein
MDRVVPVVSTLEDMYDAIAMRFVVAAMILMVAGEDDEIHSQT